MAPADHHEKARAVVAASLILVVAAVGAGLAIRESSKIAGTHPPDWERNGDAIALAERLYYENNVLDAAWVGHLRPEGVRLRAMAVRWHVRPKQAYLAYLERTGVDLLILNEEDRVWAQVADIGDAAVSCDAADMVRVGGIAIRLTPYGFAINDRAMNYTGLCAQAHPDPKGCLHDSAVVQRGGSDERTAGAASSAIGIDDADMQAIEERFPRLEGPPDNPIERTLVVLAAEHTGRGSIYVVCVGWTLTAMLSPHGGADVFWVTGKGDILASLSGVGTGGILEIGPNFIRLRDLDDTVRFRDGVLSTSIRYLDRAAGDGPFAGD